MNTRTLPGPWHFRLDRHDDPEPDPQPDPAPDPAADPAPEPEDKALGPAGEKALAAMKERARQAEAEKKALEAKVREFEDRDKSELEKAQAAAARATAEAEAARTELARTRILAEHGLTEADGEFLPAGTEEEMRAAASRLAARVAAPAKTGPKPDPSQGSGRPVTPTDFRTAPRAELEAELAKYGVRLQ